MPEHQAIRSARRRGRPGAAPIRACLAAGLGVLSALLISCGGSGSGLIPAADAGPLQSDFEAVERAAEAGNGSCSGTEAAIAKTEQDLRRLPAGINGGLRGRIEEGVTHLHNLALAKCAQPAPQPTVTSTTPTVQSTPSTTTTTPTVTQTTPTQTTPTSTATVPTTTGPGGGTPAPGEGTPGEPPETEHGRGRGGGTGAGEGNGGGQGK